MPEGLSKEIKNAGLNGFPKPEIYEVNTAPGEKSPILKCWKKKPIEIKVPDTPKPLYNVTITCTALNIRTGAGMAYAKTGEYARCGDVYGVCGAYHKRHEMGQNLCHGGQVD